MQSVSESKQELEASIRYAENAISSAKATIESMEFRQEMAKKQSSEQTGREQALEAEVAELKQQLEEAKTNMALLTDEAEFYKKSYTELEVAQGKGVPTMPVIPKAVAIAIFREGMEYGAKNVCDELDNSNDVHIEETGYTGPFEVSYSGYIDLSEHLDFDWLRDKAFVGATNEDWVVQCLNTLCADNKFECRIHGIDDPQEKKND
jgi:hypothetical protein